MRKRDFWVVVLIAITLAGCATKRAEMTSSAEKTPPTMVARYTPVPVKIDGNLDDSAWKCAAVYTLTLVRDLTDKGVCLQQHGEVRIAWDDKYFYVGVKYYDDDVVAQGKADQEAHFQFGDLAELFLKPKNNTWYWEMYVTPAEKKTRYWFAGSGRLDWGTIWVIPVTFPSQPRSRGR